MCRRVTVVCVLLLTPINLTIGCGGNQGTKAQEVTFAQLLTNPDQYDDRYVSTEGFYFHGFEVIVLSEKLEYSGFAPGHLIPTGKMVWIEGGIPREAYDRLYQQQMMGPLERYGKVRVTGRFEFEGKYGHVGAYNSQIVPTEVLLLPWSPPAER